MPLKHLSAVCGGRLSPDSARCFKDHRGIHDYEEVPVKWFSRHAKEVVGGILLGLGVAVGRRIWPHHFPLFVAGVIFLEGAALLIMRLFRIGRGWNELPALRPVWTAMGICAVCIGALTFADARHLLPSAVSDVVTYLAIVALILIGFALYRNLAKPRLP